MGHNWGFGRWKEKWLSTKNLVNEYLGVLGSGPYHKREEPKIFEWLKTKGFKPQASSQDYLKQSGILKNNQVRIAFQWNYGLPIGREGLHCRRQDFEKMELDKITISTSQVPERLPDFGEQDYLMMLDRTRREMLL